MPLPPASQAQPSRWRADLGWVVAATLASFLIASALELQESLAHRLARFERWQADELPFSLTVLALGLAWYALRRRRELQAELVLRARAEARIAELLAHKRQLARQLIALQESERLALARELHDELGQSCTAIRIETAYLRHCAADDRAGLLAAAGRADAAALGLYEGVHDLLRRLRPANLDTLGLGAAVQELCEAWQRRTGIVCDFRQPGSAGALGDMQVGALDGALDITIYRVAQDALTNIARHAGAGAVQVRLARSEPGWVTLCVQDDGCGIDPQAATRGLGLLGAEERASAVGGELRVSGTPGGGTRIELRIPVPPTLPMSPAAS
jgi:two-component system sensor histidine kinase UhpB